MADGRKNNGGKRVNAGRKGVHDELEARELSIKAIEKVYGSKQAGLEHCLESGEPTLIKFVLEHAFGKPKEHVEHSGEMGIVWNEVKNYGANS